VEVVLDQLEISYGNRVVQSGFSLLFSGGESVALQGANGVGKSTLLRCVAGQLNHYSGVVLVNGRVPDETETAFRRDVAVLLDDSGWYPSLTVAEHVQLAGLVNAPTGAPSLDPAVVVDTLGLKSFNGASPARLSSGQRQRLALAMTFVRPSRLLVLDEPERHLDTSGRTAAAELLQTYVRSGGAALVATHDNVIAEGCRVVQVLDDGVAHSGSGR
jgi:ABC-2 type transport system ATP-binding protein